ncbi:MAG: SURF1 family protein [Leifsonia sp.]
MLRMMVRPRWVLALLAALAIAAGFALLGQWQLTRAVESGHVEQQTTEIVVPLAEKATPAEPIRQTSTGQMVTSSGHWVPGDEQIVGGRLNGSETGFWVVSHFAVDDAGGAGLPVARGWARDVETARSVAEDLASAPDDPVTITGRLLPTEAPTIPADGADPHSMTTVSSAALINLWADFDDQDVYAAYLVDAEAAPGLDLIDSPVPEHEVELNWLNIFYAVEWVVFAGFAIFLWYRLVRDAYEREQEEDAIVADGDGADRSTSTAP